MSSTTFDKLYPYQKEGVLQLLKWRHALLADSAGLGKSAQALGLVNLVQAKRVLIICPASIKINWRKEIEKWFPGKDDVQILEGRSDEVQPFSRMVIVNYDLIIHSNIFQQLKSYQWDVLICDEAHKLKSLKSQRTKAVLATGGLIHNCKSSIMITGSPVLNRPIELYPILKVCSPNTIKPYDRYDRYAKRFCDAWQDGFSLNVDGASHLDDLNTRLRANYMIRRTEKDINMQLPAKRYEVFYVTQPENMKAQIKQLENIDKKDFDYQNLAKEDEHVATLRRNVAMKKMFACEDHIEDIVKSCDKLVIFAYHRDVIAALKLLLIEYHPVVLQGGMSAIAKDVAVQSFQKDEWVKVFIGQIDASGEGIDGLQNVCCNILFLECSWTPEIIKQAVARLSRLGQTRPVLIQFFVWENSVEEHLMRVALEKVSVVKAILK